MAMQAQQVVPVQSPFTRSRELFDMLCGRLQNAQALTMTHTGLEQLLLTDGRAVLAQMLQDHLDLRGLHERAKPHRQVVGHDGIARPHRREATRALRTLLGDVRVPRIGYSQRGASSRFPMDAALNLPNDPFSLGVRYAVALACASSSFESSVNHIEAMTGVHVAKRQVEKLARAAADDFEDFYEQRRAPEPAASSSLLVLSCDQKGIVVQVDDLRPATRKAALARRRRLKTKLTKGEKKHAKRMAMVTTVYSIAPHLRSAEDILADLMHETAPEKRTRPHAEQKRVWATIAKEAEDAITKLFDEAERRDPRHQKQWVVCVDGNKEQLSLVGAEAARRGVTITIVLDFIHVLQYLWKASTAFHVEAAPEREDWVLERLGEILRGKAIDVAAGMRRSATLRELAPKRRAPVDQCADYLLQYKAYLRYDEYLRDGLPIASGVIEGACRHLVNDRLGIAGAHWSVYGAEAILQLRALQSSGDLAEYWEFHEAREYGRNHAQWYGGDVPMPYRPHVRPVLRLVK